MAVDIETPRLLLIEHYIVVSEHVNWLNDKHLMRYSEQQFREHDYATQHDFLGKALETGSPIVWDIRLKEDNGDAHGMGGLPKETIGSFHAHVDRQHMRADLGILIGPEYHNQGYATEAWEHVSHYLFYKEGYAKLEAGFVDENLAMGAVLTKNGWVREGIRIRHFVYDGKLYDLMLYGKVR